MNRRAVNGTSKFMEILSQYHLNSLINWKVYSPFNLCPDWVHKFLSLFAWIERLSREAWSLPIRTTAQAFCQRLNATNECDSLCFCMLAVWITGNISIYYLNRWPCCLVRWYLFWWKLLLWKSCVFNFKLWLARLNYCSQ